MRKKKNKHEVPLYSKINNKNNRSRSKHSIMHYHDSKLNEFQNNHIKLNTILLEIEKINDELGKLNKDNIKNKEILILNKRLLKLNNELKDTKKMAKSETEYLLSTSGILLKYMELDEKEKQNVFNKDTGDEGDQNLFDIYKKKIELTHEYMQIVDPDYHISSSNIIDYDICKDDVICYKCNVILEIDDGCYVCYSCGYCKIGIEQSNEPSYKELQDYVYKPQFTYQKQTHLEDWLRRFQSKENRIIEQTILDKVIIEARKQRITDLNTLTEEKVKKFLKKLNLNEYYDNVIAIINRINGRPPFQLTVEIENKIKVMFQQIQEPFIKHKPSSRKNFLSYAYCLRQFFTILNLPEFAKYFPLLKSADKLRQQDEIFKKIVVDMVEIDKSINWVFHPTI